MTREVLVVSHADADGHVIAEQVRRNLASIPGFHVTTLVDPARTKDHRAWLHLDSLEEAEQCDLLFFVDLMFDPSTFSTEADALVRFAHRHASKKIFVMDHHPLPVARLGAATNIRAAYRRDVFDCTFGSSSWMMVIAALCEKQPTRARKGRRPVHNVLAKGLKRAAALGGSLPGDKLSALLRYDRWADLELLGREDKSLHRLPRGRRPKNSVMSPELQRLDETATQLLRTPREQRKLKGDPMPYDFEGASDFQPLHVPAAIPRRPNDLEAIVTLLELSAIYLSPTPGTEFSASELIAQAKEIGGAEVAIEEEDVLIVLDKAGFLKRSGKKLLLK